MARKIKTRLYHPRITFPLFPSNIYWHLFFPFFSIYPLSVLDSLLGPSRGPTCHASSFHSESHIVHKVLLRCGSDEFFAPIVVNAVFLTHAEFFDQKRKKKKEDRLSRVRFMPSRVWILVRPLARDQIQVLGFFLPPISRRKRPNIRKRDKATSNELPKTRNKKTRRILTLISRARSHKTHSYFLSAVVKKNPLDKSNIDRTLQARHFDIRVIVYVTVDERASWKSPWSVDTRSFDRDWSTRVNEIFFPSPTWVRGNNRWFVQLRELVAPNGTIAFSRIAGQSVWTRVISRRSGENENES